MIELHNITKSFHTEQGRHFVLKDVSLHFPYHVNVGILGPNGSGKSTLLKLISGGLLPDQGEIIRRANISWPLGFAGGFHGSLTGRENLRFICRIYKADIRKVLDFVVEFSELGKFMDVPIKAYSTGMRAKLAFSLSMAIEFECYLIDEITAVGDAAFRKKAEDAFQERRERATLLVVSHNPGTIAKLCDKVAVIEDAKVTLFESKLEGIQYYKSQVLHI